MVGFRPITLALWTTVGLSSGCLGSGDIHVITGYASESGTSGGEDETSTSSGPSSTTWIEDAGSDPFEGPRFDVSQPTWTEPPLLPTTCVQAYLSATSTGCQFYPIDLDRTDPSDLVPTWVVVINPHLEASMLSTLFERVNDTWVELEPEVTIAPGDYYVYTLKQREQDGSGFFQAEAFRLRTNLPATAYQFSGVDAYTLEGSASTLLLPVSAWTSHYRVLGWNTNSVVNVPSYFAAVAHHNGTVVSIVPSAPTLPGNLVGSGSPDDPLSIPLQISDIAQVAVAKTTEEIQYGLTGTVVQTGGEHPIALFSAHACAAIPNEASNCNHVQEQLTPYLYGTTFIAPALPARDPDNPESTLWQIYALENGTSIQVVGASNPSAQNLVLEAGSTYELWQDGNTPGLEIHASRQVAIAGYVTNHTLGPPTTTIGGPEMFQLSPTDRWLNRYALFTLPGWEWAYASIVRPLGVAVRVDGTPVDDALFSPAGDDYEVAAVPLADAMAHIVDSDEPILVISLGYGEGSAYASLAGWGTQRPGHDPIP